LAKQAVIRYTPERIAVAAATPPEIVAEPLICARQAARDG
jgi:hypothetical protein